MKRRTTQSEKILEELKQKELTGYRLSVLTGIRIDVVFKRLSDLWNDGKIEQTGKFNRNLQGQVYAIYRVVPEQDRQKIIQKRRNQLNINWLMQGKQNGYISQKQYDEMIYSLTEKMNNYDKIVQRPTSEYIKQC